MADEPTSTPLNQWLASERAAADVAFHLKRGLWLLESKFSYNRWTGLVELVEIVSQLVQSRDERHRKQFLPHMAECKTQSRVFGLILDGSRTRSVCFARPAADTRTVSDKFTPVTSKELALSLELLLHCQRLYPWNPHSKGFTVLNRLVVETAQPLVQAPALKYARALIAAQPANAKSFRKSGGVETLGKWCVARRVLFRFVVFCALMLLRGDA